MHKFIQQVSLFATTLLVWTSCSKEWEETPGPTYIDKIAGAHTWTHSFETSYLPGPQSGPYPDTTFTLEKIDERSVRWGDHTFIHSDSFIHSNGGKYGYLNTNPDIVYYFDRKHVGEHATCQLTLKLSANRLTYSISSGGRGGYASHTYATTANP